MFNDLFTLSCLQTVDAFIQLFYVVYEVSNLLREAEADLFLFNYAFGVKFNTFRNYLNILNIQKKFKYFINNLLNLL